MHRAATVVDDLTCYNLLASAMAGRTMRVVRARAAEPSHSDGHHVRVRRRDGATETGSDLEEMIVQAALVRAGSLDAEVMRRLVGRPALARRYAVLEVNRALASLGALLPGLSVDHLFVELPVHTLSAEESLRVAMTRRRLPDPPPVYGAIRPRRVLAHAGSQTTAASAAGSSASPEKMLVDDGELAVNEDEETAELGFLRKLFAEAGLTASLKLLKKLGVGRERAQGPAGAEAMSGVARMGTGRTTSLVTTHLSPSSLSRETDGWHPHAGWSYPEWDVRRGRYREKWCTVVEVDPTDEEGEAPPRTESVVLRRALRRLALGQARRRHQRDGDEIDIDAAIAAQVDLRTRRSPDERFYIANRRIRQDLACLVLLDISGSASDPAAEGSVHGRQIAAASVLAESLDRVALYGFRSQGRSEVDFVRVKAFDDALDQRVYARLGSLLPEGFTRAGAGIRHATRVLKERGGTSRLLLIMISDGFFYDDGYEGRYAEADVRGALAEAQQQGVGAACLTFGSDAAEDSLRTIFGGASWASAERIENIAPDMARIFLAGLAGVERQRSVPAGNRPAGARHGWRSVA